MRLNRVRRLKIAAKPRPFSWPSLKGWEEDAKKSAKGLYAIHGAIHDIDWRELPADLKQQYKAFTAELRESRQFNWAFSFA